MSIPILHAVDTVSKQCSTGDATITKSFTVDNAADRVIEISACINTTEPGAVAVLTATYDGVALGVTLGPIDNGARLEVWHLIAPNVGTANLVVIITDPPGGTTRAVTIGIRLYKNANQTAPFVTARAGSKTGAGGYPTLTVLAMDEELVSVSVAAQEDRTLDEVSGQDPRWSGAQAGDSGAETILGKGSTKVGAGYSTDVGWDGASAGNANYGIKAVPICGPDVGMEGRGSTSNAATASMSRLVPLEADATGSAIGAALVSAANWLRAFATGQAKATVTLLSSTFLRALASAQAIAGARVETDARLFAINTAMVIVPFEINLSASALRDEGIEFQSAENGVILRFTIKNAGVVVSLVDAFVWLHVSGIEFSPFPLSITNAGNGIAEYIVGLNDLESGEYEAQIDVLLPSANRYRSGAFPLTVVAAVS